MPPRRRAAAMNSRRSHSITSSARESNDVGHGEAERLGGLQVNRKLEFGRRLHRKVGRFLALKDAIDVASGPPVRSIVSAP